MSLDALISIRVKYLLRAIRLVASCERAISRAIGYKDEGRGNWRPWNMRRSQETDGRCAVVKICPYLRFRMPDGLPKILYVGFESCVRWPLFVKVNPSEQMELAGRDSCWHRDPKSCQRLPPPTWWPNQSRGEGRLGYMSHDLRQFLVRRLPPGFDELDDEGIYVHRGLLSVPENLGAGVQTQVCFRPRKGGLASALQQVFSSTDYSIG
jgi:hypothetical protein